MSNHEKEILSKFYQNQTLLKASAISRNATVDFFSQPTFRPKHQSCCWLFCERDLRSNGLHEIQTVS